MSNLRLKVLFTILIAYSGVLLFTLLTNQPSNEKVSNKSIISIDNQIGTVYIEYTDDIQAIKDYTLATNLKELETKRKLVLEEKKVAALKLAEEKRVAEAKRIAEEKRQIELAKVAEENRIGELARIEEEKRVAALVAKRDAKNKEKQENKKTQVASVSRGNNYQSNYEVTFYTAYCSTGCTGVTASGHSVSDTIYYQGYRIVAAPPNIPLYTKLRITFGDGSKMDAIALDRGGRIQGKILDILVADKDEAIRMGRQQVKVEVIN